MKKVRYMDEEILKMYIPVNSKIIDQILKVSSAGLVPQEKATA
jgi:hypothetical protein